jgi:hypothetical protein
MMAPLGTVVGGGLTFSTFITLIYVPCMYIYAENIANGIRKLFRRKPRADDGQASAAGDIGAAGAVGAAGTET